MTERFDCGASRIPVSYELMSCHDEPDQALIATACNACFGGVRTYLVSARLSRRVRSWAPGVAASSSPPLQIPQRPIADRLEPLLPDQVPYGGIDQAGGVMNA